jgi:hypothetical protein
MDDQIQAQVPTKLDKAKGRAKEILEIDSETHKLIAAGILNPRLIKIGSSSRSSSGPTTQVYISDQA